jgi:hypothetical protein
VERFLVERLLYKRVFRKEWEYGLIHVMGLRRSVVFVIMTAIVFGTGLILLWPSGCPVELKAMNVEASGIVDDEGLELRLVTLNVTNPNGARFYLKRKWIEAEARVGGRWLKTENKERLKLSGDTVLLMPSGTDTCRLHVTYARPSLKEQLWQLMGARARKIVFKIPIVYNWFLPPGRGGWRTFSPGHWRRVAVEVKLPRKAEQSTPKAQTESLGRSPG